MEKAFDQYPKKWGLKQADSNIDHRRVLNLMAYFQRQGWSMQASKKAADFHPGDVVAWDLGGGVTHVGIVSDRSSAKGTPLVIHNIGRGAQEEDILFHYDLIGHYRPRLDKGKLVPPKPPKEDVARPPNNSQPASGNPS